MLGTVLCSVEGTDLFSDATQKKLINNEENGGFLSFLPNFIQYVPRRLPTQVRFRTKGE